MKTDKELKSRTRRITRKEALKVLVGDKHAVLKLFEDFTIYIFMAQNGAALVSDEGAAVFMFDEDNLAGLSELHYTIDGVLGFSGSKYNKERLYHRIEHGSSYTCQEKGCAICRDEALSTGQVVE